MASINGRLVNGNDPIVKARRAQMDARFAAQRQMAEESATPIGQTTTWGNHGPQNPSTGKRTQ